MNIEESISLIFETLSRLITQDYVYLDIPGHNNVGDHLIALGAYKILDRIPHKCLYKSSVTNFRKEMIPSNATILLHGGGNFGNLYPGANQFRNQIVLLFPNNRIIFLPQTITYVDNSLIEFDSKICSQHNDLHICARDNDSMEILKKYFYRNHIYLLPDTAICLKINFDTKRSHPTKGVLVIKRKDNEIGDDSIQYIGNVKDWDDILHECHYEFILFFAKVLNKLRKETEWSLICTLSNFYLVRIQEPFIYHRVSRYIQQYSKIVSTRLHGYILAKILDIPVEWDDTKYGKISSYCKTWEL